MSGRKRTIQIKFYVTEEERNLITEKMKLIPTRNIIRKQRGNNFINMETEKFLCYTDCTLH